MSLQALIGEGVGLGIEKAAETQRKEPDKKARAFDQMVEVGERTEEQIDSKTEIQTSEKFSKVGRSKRFLQSS